MRLLVRIVVLVFILGPLCMTIVATAYQVLLPDCVEPDQRGITNGINVLLAFVAGMALLLLAFRLWEQQPAVIFHDDPQLRQMTRDRARNDTQRKQRSERGSSRNEQHSARDQFRNA